MKNRLIIISLCIMFPLFFCGCWDKVEIDRRAFIATIAIDPGKDIDKYKELKNMDSNEPFLQKNIKKLNVIYGYPNISMLGPEKGGTVEEKRIYTEAYSMQDSITKATNKSSRNIHLGHNKILMINKNLFYYPEVIREIMDYFGRNSTVNRTMDVIITEGKAEEYEQFKPGMEKNFQSYISGLMENSGRDAAIMKSSFNDLAITLRKDGDVIIPYVKKDKEKNEILLCGLAVIKDYKIVGTIDCTGVVDVEILKGSLKGGKKVIYKEGHPVDFVIDGMHRTLKLKNIDDKSFEMDINIDLEGEIKGVTIEKEILSSEIISDYEKNFNKVIGIECKKTMKIFQEKFGVDPFTIREHIEKYHPYKWKKIQNNWAEVFKNAKINININSKVRRIGIIK